MQEIWKDIKEYEGEYEISNLGRVRSLNYRRTGMKKVLKPINHPRGYLSVILYKNKKSKEFCIHRLVAETFIENLSNKPQVNHKDGNKHNNTINNLEWVTASKNEKHAWKIGLKTDEHIKKIAQNNSKPILQYDLNNKLLKEWGSISEASRDLNIKQSGISSCCRKVVKTSGGYIWKYKK